MWMLNVLLVLSTIVAISRARECEDLCPSSSVSPNCFCTQCEIYDDCCSNIKTKEASEPNRFSCDVKLGPQHYVYSVSRCASSWPHNDTIRLNCEQRDNGWSSLNENQRVARKTPIYSNSTGLVYANIYCAVCNQLGADDGLIPFQITHTYDRMHQDKTSSQIVLKKQLENNQELTFDVSVKIPKDMLRRCVPVVKTCAGKNEENKNETQIELCEKGPNAYRYTYNHNVIFKNVHCAECNQLEDLDNLLCVKPQPPSDMQRTAFNSLQLLFDLSFLKGEIMMTIQIRVDNQELNASEITFVNGTTSLVYSLNDLKCKFYAHQHDSTDDLALAKRYLTICGQTVSIVCLFLLLFMYFSHKSLRNLPGLILISLSLALMLSQICFLISVYVTESYLTRSQYQKDMCFDNEFSTNKELVNAIRSVLDCYLLGMLTHYFYLAFFIWTNTMAFDLYTTLKRLDPASKSPVRHGSDESSDRRLFIRYSSYAWTTPLLIVAALTCKQFVTERHRMSYGYRACYISTNFDLLMFFVLPVAVILLVNLFFLVMCIRMIRAVDRSTGKYLTQEGSTHSRGENSNKRGGADNKNRLVLFIKLFSLTGMTWLLGILSSFFHNSPVWYVYLVLNSLQGAFILFAFAFNAKTKNLVKKSSAYRAISSAIGSTRRRSPSTMGTESTNN